MKLFGQTITWLAIIITVTILPFGVTGSTIATVVLLAILAVLMYWERINKIALFLYTIFLFVLLSFIDKLKKIL